jgi:hypothetical protein
MRGNSVGLLFGSMLGASMVSLSGVESIAKQFEHGGGLGLVEHRP